MSPEIRHLVAVITSPTLRSDGSILQVPGWDARTGLLYRPAGLFPEIPESPSKKDVREAIRALMEVIKDFPLKGDEDRAAWVALLLSLIGRQAINGCVPMFVATGNVPGCGKGLLVDAAHLIACGVPAPKRANPPDEEMQKVITSAAIAGLPSIVLDNVRAPLGGEGIESALTARTVAGRKLGTSEYFDNLSMRIVWMATGNNVTYIGDFARRTVAIRIESPLEKPDRRTDMEQADLSRWVQDNRPRLAAAALTLLRGWFAAGSPLTDDQKMASYEDWSRVVRGTILWAGLADPFGTQSYSDESDESSEMLGLLISGIRDLDVEGVGVSVKEMLLAVQGYGGQELHPALSEAMDRLNFSGKINPRYVSKRLQEYLNRVKDGHRIVRSKTRTDIFVYTVEQVEDDSGLF